MFFGLPVRLVFVHCAFCFHTARQHLVFLFRFFAHSNIRVGSCALAFRTFVKTATSVTIIFFMVRSLIMISMLCFRVGSSNKKCIMTACAIQGWSTEYSATVQASGFKVRAFSFIADPTSVFTLCFGLSVQVHVFRVEPRRLKDAFH